VRIRSVRYFGASWLAVACVGLPLLSGCSSNETALASRDAVAHGKYLVETLACSECHTPWTMGPAGPQPDASLLLSGHPSQIVLTPPTLPPGWPTAFSETNTAAAGPWGISYAANLTPDDTGLGVWSEDVFTKAMRTGKHMGVGRPILPPMPWQAYGQLTDQDLGDVWAYLQTIPPIENVVPLPTPPQAPAEI
jgi:mono/diheme cytochrome c family protein